MVGYTMRTTLGLESKAFSGTQTIDTFCAERHPWPAAETSQPTCIVHIHSAAQLRLNSLLFQFRERQVSFRANECYLAAFQRALNIPIV